MIEKKKTRKQIAEDLGQNVKTIRNLVRLSEALDYLKNNVGEELYTEFEKTLNSIWKNKKAMPSYDSLKKMVMLPQDIQIKICKNIIKHPMNAKTILGNSMGDAQKIKVTVTLPQSINDYYKMKSEEYGMSRNKYIEWLLCKLAEAELE
mgnify:CR=1 FL=1